MISVVMPVYNGERYLSEAIESILNQTYKNFEFIIINDGSNDKTEEIILSYRDPRIIYVKNSKNLRIVKTLNKGISLAKGVYIARMDADDISLPTRFEKQLEFLTIHKDISVVGTSRYICKTYKSLYYPETHNEIKVKALFTSPILHPSIMAKKEFFEQLSYKEEFDKAEDYHIWIEGIDRFRYANLQDKMLCYRYHSSQTHSTSFDIQIKKAQIIREKYIKSLDINLTAKELQDMHTLAKYRYVELLDLEKLYYKLASSDKLKKEILSYEFSNYVFKMVRSDGLKYNIGYKEYRKSIFFNFYKPSLLEKFKYIIMFLRLKRKNI